MPDTTSQSLSDTEIVAVRKAQVGRYGNCDPSKPYADSIAFARAVEAAILAKQREMDAKAEPDAWLHKYRRTGGGESYEMADLADPKSPPEPRENFEWIGADPLSLHPPAAQDREPMTKVPAEIVRYAKAMKSDGYRGPLSWASAVIDWVAGLEWREASPSGKSVESIDAAMSKEPQR